MRSDLELMALAKIHGRDRIRATEMKRQVRCFRNAERAERLISRPRSNGVLSGVAVTKNNVLF